MDFLKAIAGLIGLADLWSRYFVKKDDQNTGKKLQQVDDLTANAKASENAAIIEDRNAALSRGDLIDKLSKQTGARP